MVVVFFIKAMDKKQLRQAIRKQKSSFSNEDLKFMSEPIQERILSHSSIQKAAYILSYWSLSDEVYTHDLNRKLNAFAKVLLPVVKGDKLELRLFTSVEEMKEVPPYGIKEPQGESFTDYAKIDVALIPGMAFDDYNNRLGRGKAFYDGLLPLLNCKKIGICFDFQKLTSIPIEDHDIVMDEII